MYSIFCMLNSVCIGSFGYLVWLQAIQVSRSWTTNSGMGCIICQYGHGCWWPSQHSLDIPFTLPFHFSLLLCFLECKKQITNHPLRDVQPFTAPVDHCPMSVERGLCRVPAPCSGCCIGPECSSEGFTSIYNRTSHLNVFI